MKYWFYVAVTEKMGTIRGFCKNETAFFPFGFMEKDLLNNYNQKAGITYYKEISKEEYEFQTGGEG